MNLYRGTILEQNIR